MSRYQTCVVKGVLTATLVLIVAGAVPAWCAGSKEVRAAEKIKPTASAIIWGIGLVAVPMDGGQGTGSALQGRLEYKKWLVDLLLGGQAGQSVRLASSTSGTQDVIEKNLGLSAGLRVGWIIKKSRQYRLYPALTGGGLYQRQGTDWRAGGFGRLGLGFDYLLPGAKEIALNFETGVGLSWLDQTLSYGAQAGPFGLFGVTWRFLP